jgi:hypothetical protein
MLHGQTNIKRYITHPHCQPVFPISALLYEYEKFIGGKVKQLTFN